jgi:hypothetical protein
MSFDRGALFGQREIAAQRPRPAAVVVHGWTEELKRRVPGR